MDKTSEDGKRRVRLRDGRFGGTIVTLYGPQHIWLYVTRNNEEVVDLYKRTTEFAHKGRCRIFAWAGKCTIRFAIEAHNATLVTFSEGTDEVTFNPFGQ